MNQKLQNILEIIQQSEKLDAEQKENLVKAVKDADKELEITTFKLERTEKVKKTTAILLEETIEELEQKRKAVEDQNRELEIEASLERIRTRTMAMQESNELAETTALFFKQFKELNLLPDKARTYFSLFDTNTDTAVVWLTQADGSVRPGSHSVPLKGSAQVVKVYEGWKQKEPIIIRDMTGKNLAEYLNFLSTLPHVKKDEALQHLISSPPKRIVFSEATFRYGTVGIMSGEPLSQEAQSTLIRFAKVFEQTYTRFLDLQKAEAQAREAQIEASLERVRARSMAMHESQELREIIDCVFEELQKLDFVAPACSLIFYQDDKSAVHWFAGFTEGAYPQSYTIPYIDIPYYTDLMKAWEEGSEYEEFIMEGKAKVDYAKWLLSETDFQKLPKEFVEGSGMQTPVPLYFSDAYNKYGMLEIIGNESLPKDKVNIVKRMSKVFEQTYTRFLDLQKAEAQAREAETETALERVRSRSMAMHKSDEIAAVASVLFHQLQQLNIPALRRCLIGIVEESNETLQSWYTSMQGDSSHKIITYPISGHPVIEAKIKSWREKKPFSIELTGKKMEDFLQYTLSHGFELQKGEVAAAYMIQNHAPFKYGYLEVATHKPITHQNFELLNRFANVFEQTYTRFLDLQKAEALAREAVKQAALDRVRGEIASMRTSEDLNRITPVIWHELKALEVPFIRCGVFIVNENEAKTHVYLSTPDGKALGVLNLSFDANELTSNTVEHWRKKQIYKEHWNKEEFINWTKSMMELGQVQNAETYQGSSKPPESLNLHFVPFTQGMLYVGDVSPLTDEKLDLVKTLAEAFSIAYARYEDFKNLEEAKNKIELTLSELKSAQAQLVHSEKMASLGELTAGIAHEIKNPLNFVNNFSEISGELLDEVKAELEKNDKEEVLAILEDLKGNLEKINQHGKRADSIVKGMLLHSRGTSGEKALTDINDLLDQYVNLAYHGMRATNKEFNITIEKDYDKTLEKINVVPQDISRVFLNIINNACYAAYDRKKKSSESDFSPTLKVSTKNKNEKVEIRIGDNGGGIPQNILDKIFQPFFTTKPTGEGTGLGLSLSYDIVTKVHSGELKVETKKGEGTDFIVKLPKA